MDVELTRGCIEAIAAEVAALLEQRPAPGPLLTAGQVAARFNVERGWVYAHAQELGVVRLTASRRSRLRFDPALVAQRLLAEAPAPAAPRAVSARATVPLLPIRGRSLDGSYDKEDH